ncbi:MAG: DUF2752 domain-containing protein [Bryobacteraceae bacterium]
MKRAILLAWVVLSGVLAMTLAAAVFVPAAVVEGFSPECEAKRQGSECPLCGMTTAFLHLGRGDFTEAGRANRASVPLSAFFLGNVIVAAVVAGKWINRCRR